MKVLLRRFPLNEHAPEFCPQTQKFEPPYKTLLFTLEGEEVEQESIFKNSCSAFLNVKIFLDVNFLFAQVYLLQNA